MTRINTNVTSLVGQRVLGQNNNDLGVSLERLSTGLRINRGADDPAGLIASQNLRSEIAGLDQAIKNAERADQVVNIAEGGLNEVSALLNELQGLIVESANTGGLSTEERNANQLQIDSILQTIDRVASATSFQGLKLLNGNLDYATANVSAQVADFKVNGAKLDFGETLDVDVIISQSAQLGGLLLSFGGGNIDLGGTGASDGANEVFTIEVAGSQGARELSFSSGTTLAGVRDSINTFTDVTGVSARVSGSQLVLNSAKFGSEEFVSVKIVNDGNIDVGSNEGIYGLNSANTNAVNAADQTLFNTNGARNGISDFGQDVGATINGVRATTSGKIARIDTDFLNVEINLEYDTAGSAPNAAILGALSAFTITGGGADFQLSSKVNIAGKVGIGIGNVAVRELGRIEKDVSGARQVYFLSDLSTGQDLSVVTGDTAAAQQAVETAIREVSGLRGRLGAFQKNVIGATIRSTGVSLENTTAAESVVRDADFAEETAELTRSQILVQSTTQILGIANSQPQAALSLLG